MKALTVFLSVLLFASATQSAAVVTAEEPFDFYFEQCFRNTAGIDDELLDMPLWQGFTVTRDGKTFNSIPSISFREGLLSVPDVRTELTEDGLSYSWQTPDTGTEKHRELWRQAGVEFPAIGKPSIMLFLEGGHWAHQQMSILASRSDDGTWSVVELADRRAFIGEQPYRITRRSLNPGVGDHIDHLIIDDCLWAEPTLTRWSKIVTSDGWAWTMEMETERGVRISRSSHDGMGRTGLLYSLLRRTN